MSSKPLRVGLIGAGIGGLAAAISLCRNGVDVTVLEAARELGEIGAGIQMTPNVARLLIRWGVVDVIGDNLVEFEELNMRRRDGTKVGYSKIRTREQLGMPWWLVHRMHLHEGLVKVARKEGARLVVGARVHKLDYASSPVKVTTESGDVYTFDLVIGSDGINSIVRRTIHPDVKPAPPTTNCAYRAIVPYEQIRKDPVARELVEKMTMEVWMARKIDDAQGYIISYPISAGKDFNMVLSHHVASPLDHVEDVSIEEVRETYKSFDPRIVRIINMISHPMKRWPLMVTRCPSWSSPQKNMVLMGDAAHSMVNHMAQGAATSMEDGAFLGILLGAVAKGEMKLAEAVDIYEKERMPLADIKQQLSFMNGAIWHLPDGPEQEARDKMMEGELRGEQLLRSPNLYADPWTMLTCYGYDPEAHANRVVEAWKRDAKPRDAQTHVTDEQKDIYMNWFLPETKKDVVSKL